MTMTSRWRAVFGASLAAVAFTSCDDPTNPPTQGAIEPRIALIQPDSSTRASLVLPLTSVRARSIGPTGKVVDLTLQGSTWRGSLTDLDAGTYEVIIEGIAAGQVQFYGRIPTVTVARGQRAQPSIPFAAAVPTVSNPSLNNTTSFSQRIPFARIAAASGYVVQLSQDNTFPASGLIETAVADTAPLVTVNGTGQWFVRTRAVLPQVTPSSIPWSDTRSWTVIEATGGNDAAAAQPLALVSEVPQTTTDRNLTAVKRQDWYSFALRQGDSLFVETFAARLANVSPLNTTLTLFEDDGTTQVAQSLDATGTTDSRIVYVPDITGTYRLAVGATGTSSGHYELRSEIRRLPAAPTGLVTTIVSGTQVTLDWSDASDNETSFRIERCVGDACSDFAEFGEVATDVTTFTVDTLTQGLTYRWRVRARNGVGNSAFTDVGESRLVGPAAPTALEATTASATEIGLLWTDASNNETGFEIERCTGVACTTFVAIDTVPTDAEFYSDVSAVYNTAYRYRVRALNAVIPSAYSNEVAANTIPPTTPTGLTATVAGATRIDLAWTDASSDETYFLIERCTGDGCTTFAQVDSVAAGVTSYQDTGVAFNAAYRYRIRARSAVVSQTYTAIAAADTRPPTAPTALSATTQGPTAIALAWTDNADDETGYRIERCGGAACTSFALVTTVAVNATGYTDTGVTVDNSYRYRVIAVGVPGNSAPSDTAAANTLRPSAPTGLTATTVTANVIRLAWTDAANNETGYSITRCDTDGCTNHAEIATITGAAVTYDDSTTVAGESYSYIVRATNVAGASDASNTAVANTLPPSAPTGFTATLLAGPSVDLAWTNTAAGLVGTRVERCTGSSCTDFAEIDFVAAPGSTYSDATVVVGQVYRYQLRAQNAADVSAYTAIQTVSAELPTAATNLSGYLLDATTVRLDWTAATGVNLSGYVVESCSGSICENWATVTTLGAAATTYDATIVAPDTLRFRLQSQSVVGNVASTAVTVVADLPAQPTGVTAEVRVGFNRITWDAVPVDQQMRVSRCEGDPCGVETEIGVALAGAASYDDATVTTNQTYRYRVRAENALGLSPYSAEVLASTFLATPPSGLSASTASPTRVDLTWTDNALAESGFEIERCGTVGCADFAVIDTVASNVTTYADLSVTQGNDYVYRVRATAPAGSSAESNEAAANTRLPSAPTGLVATTLSNTSIRLTWTDNSDNETQFSISRCSGVACEVPAGNFVATSPNVLEYVDNGLDPNQTYRYLVRAANTVGSSAPTDTATATTNLPPIPTAFRAIIQDPGAINLQWTDVGPDETAYEIERCEGAACDTFAPLTTTAADATFFSDIAITDGTTYRYRIRAVNAAGASDFATAIEVTAGAPVAPTGVAANTVGPNAIQLTWTNAANNHTGTEISRCAGDGCGVFAVIDTVGSAETIYTDVSAATGEYYSYQLTAFNGAGVSAAAGPVSANTFPPGAPTGLVATTASATSVELTWTDGGPFETAYEIDRCEGDPCGAFTTLTTVPANTVTYTDAGLTPNTSYSYRVRAGNLVAFSAYSNTATAATNVPATPSALTAVAQSATAIQVDWTDNSDNETDFLLEFCEGEGCASFGFLALLAANVETYSHGGLTPGQSYTYRLQAVGSVGNSPFIGPVTTNTALPAAPTSFSATTLGPTQIELAWADTASNELSFLLERCTGPGCTSYATVATIPADSTVFVDAGVSVDQVYGYRLRAVNNVGESDSLMLVANTLRPASPQNFTATTVSSEQVDLTWTDASDNESTFRIERCTGPGCADFTTLVTLPAGSVAHQDVGLTPQTSYTYRIFAVNVAGDSDGQDSVTATTELPLTPTDLVAVATSASTIELTWTDAATNELGYRIERCTGSGCTSWVEVGTVAADQTTYTSTGLSASTFYRHQVRAYNAAGTSPYAGPVTTFISGPTAPTGLSATTQNATEVQLEWTDNASNETGFEIQRCTGPTCTDWLTIVTWPANPTSGQTIYLDPTAPTGVTVRYRVRAVNGVATSGFTSIASASTIVPATPTNLTAAAQGQTQILVEWTDNATDEAGYRVERCTGAVCNDGDYAVVVETAADAIAYTDNGVVGGTIYQYRVQAFGNGRSSYSNVVLVTTILPAAPSALTATAVADTRVDLAWTDNADNEENFRVLRCAGAVDCTDFVEVALVAGNSTTYSDLSAAAGTIYRYVVTAVNGAGESAPTDPATATTNVPAIPTALTATVASATQIDLAWTDNATGETGYLVERCTGDTCEDFAELITLGADAVAHIDGSVAAATTYRYRVRAFNANGNSAFSNVATAATNAPADPTTLVATVFNNARADLTWVDASNNESGFEIERCDTEGCSNFAPLTTVGANLQAYSDNSASQGNFYTYRIRAVNAAGQSGYAVSAQLNMLLPAAGTALAATTISATQIDLTWTDNADNETGVEIQRCAGPGCTLVAVDTVAAGETTYTDAGLTAGLQYTYAVVYFNLVGRSNSSNEVTASTDFPLPPTALVAVTASATQINLAWSDNSGNEVDFVIERCIAASCPTFTVIDSVPADQAVYADASVTVDNIYQYRVRARNLAGSSEFSNVVEANTLLPVTPTLISAVATGATEVTVLWNVAERADSYVIERCETGTCTYGVLAGGLLDTAYVDAAAAAGLSYDYRVYAVNAAGDGVPSAPLTVSLVVPNVPLSLSAEPISESQVRVEWTDNSSNETGFRLERCEGADCSDFTLLATTPTDSVAYVDAVTLGGRYRYRVLAANAVGNSAPSNEDLVVVETPLAPSLLNATTSGPGQISLNWQDNAVNEATYSIERCAGLLCESFVQVQTVPAGSTIYVDGGLSLNAIYRYRVRALNGVGPSGYSNIAQDNTFLPAAATSLTATVVSGGQVNLTWVDNASNEQGFRIERCEGVGCDSYVQVATVGANGTGYANVGLNYGVVYNYRVRAFNISGNAEPTNVANAPTILQAPTAIRVTIANLSNTTVTWQKPQTFESGFQVLRCGGDENCVPNTVLGSVAAGVYTFNDVVPVAGQTYRYSVRAITVNGASNIGTPWSARMPQNLAFITPLTGIEDSRGFERNWVFNVPLGALGLRVKMDSPSGDADLYVNYNAPPNSATQSFSQNTPTTCVPYNGFTPEVCTFNAPVAGAWYAMLRAFSSYSGATLKVSLAERFGSPSTVGSVGGIPGELVVAHPFTLTDSVSLTHLGVMLSAVPEPGGARVAIYSNRPNQNGSVPYADQPDALLAQVDIPAMGLGTNEVAIALAPGTEQFLPPGTYWLASTTSPALDPTYYSDGTLIVYRYLQDPQYGYVNGLPTTWPAGDFSNPSYLRTSLFIRGWR